MDAIYFKDIDCYVDVDPAEFEVVSADTILYNFLAVADQADAAGQFSVADGITEAITKLSAKYRGRTVTLNKPFRTPNGPKKFSVYTKNEKGNVVKVNFGDPDMEIKRDIPARRRSFRARHRCDNPGPKWKARYWSCRMW